MKSGIIYNYPYKVNSQTVADAALRLRSTGVVGEMIVLRIQNYKY